MFPVNPINPQIQMLWKGEDKLMRKQIYIFLTFFTLMVQFAWVEEANEIQANEWNQRIYLATYPRSGNHWVRFLIEEASHIATSSVYQDSDFRPHLPTPFPWGGYSVDGGYQGNCRYPQPHESIVIKTHFPSFKPNQFDHQPSVGAIRIIRNPIDSISSFYVYAHPSDSNYKVPKETIGDYLYSWRKFQDYWDQEPNVLTIRYEDLMDNPTYYLAQILEACKYEFTEKDLQRAANKFPAKGKAFQHLKHFDTEDILLISERLKDLLDKHGYQIPLTLNEEQ